MEIKVLRYNSKDDFTDGVMFVNDEFRCFTLEDEERAVKVYGETRIPNGRYEVKLRKEGGFHARYTKKFGSKWHKGMLHVTNVPSFKHILIHIGNDDKDTSGCLLVGMYANADEKGFIGASTQAYKKIYPEIRDALTRKEKVFIEYKNM